MLSARACFMPQKLKIIKYSVDKICNNSNLSKINLSNR